ncbi:hypothetical protein F5Y08DRAFT_320901 [Xylaria arbuscula]|nr:hypothetical protein F5Y08DRAFT_320901 [Xylaria arbuscula]
MRTLIARITLAKWPAASAAQHISIVSSRSACSNAMQNRHIVSRRRPVGRPNMIRPKQKLCHITALYLWRGMVVEELLAYAYEILSDLLVVAFGI